MGLNALALQTKKFKCKASKEEKLFFEKSLNFNFRDNANNYFYAFRESKNEDLFKLTVDNETILNQIQRLKQDDKNIFLLSYKRDINTSFVDLNVYSFQQVINCEEITFYYPEDRKVENNKIKKNKRSNFYSKVDSDFLYFKYKDKEFIYLMNRECFQIKYSCGLYEVENEVNSNNIEREINKEKDKPDIFLVKAKFSFEKDKNKINVINTFDVYIKNEQKYNNIGYINLWSKYIDFEKQELKDNVKNAGYLECVYLPKKSNGNYCAFQIKNKTNANKTIFKFDTSVSIYEHVPSFFEDDKQENYNKIEEPKLSGTVITEENDVLNIELEKDNAPKENQSYFISLSIKGDLTQLERRYVAIQYIKKNCCKMVNLPKILKGDTAFLLKQPFKAKQINFSKEVKNKVFSKHEPTSNQEEIILKALNTPDIALIQGPPGTGKTTVIAAIIEALNETFYSNNDNEKSNRGKILVTALQHDAVLNLTSRLSVNALPTPKFGGKSKKSNISDSDHNLVLKKFCNQLEQKLTNKYKYINNDLNEITDAYNVYYNNPIARTALDFLNKASTISNKNVELSVEINYLLEFYKYKYYSPLISESERQRLLHYVFALRVSPEEYLIDGYKNSLEVIYNLNKFLKDKEISFLSSPFYGSKDSAVFDKLHDKAVTQHTHLISLLNQDVTKLQKELDYLKQNEYTTQSNTGTNNVGSTEKQLISIDNKDNEDQDTFDIDLNELKEWIKKERAVNNINNPKESQSLERLCDCISDFEQKYITFLNNFKSKEQDEEKKDNSSNDNNAKELSKTKTNIVSQKFPLFIDLEKFAQYSDSEKQEWIEDFITFISIKKEGLFNPTDIKLNSNENDTLNNENSENTQEGDQDIANELEVEQNITSDNDIYRNQLIRIKKLQREIANKQKLIQTLISTSLVSLSKCTPESFSEQMEELYYNLVERLNSRQNFTTVEPLNTKLTDIYNALSKQLTQDNTNLENAVISEYIRCIQTNPEAVKNDIQKYNVVYAATVQQSLSTELLKAKGVIKDSPEYDYVIIDEAARANPMDLLIPMIQAKKIILVGDHKQLPHILDKKITEQFEKIDIDEDNDVIDDSTLDNISIADPKETLFEYLSKLLDKLSKVDNKERVFELNNQFRMHPKLGKFISENFYDNKLKSPLDASYFEHNLKFLNKQCMTWLDIPNRLGDEQKIGTSRKRDKEAEYIAYIIKEWLSQEDSQTQHMTFGIISFYQAQVKCIQEELVNNHIYIKNDDEYELNPKYNPCNIEHRLQVNTVDAFQGMEFDAVILSMVRSRNVKDRIIKNQKKKQLIINQRFGHLTSKQRLCVSMSRQRKALVVVGDFNMLNNDLAKEGVSALFNYRTAATPITISM